MHKGVKTIFVALIGTVFLIVVSFLLTEIINISLTGIRLQQDIKTACDKALTLFAQESYKVRSDDSGNDTGTIGMPSIYDCNGNEYISGRFYPAGADTVEDIYNALYRDSAEFKEWVGSIGTTGNWLSINRLWRRLDKPTEVVSQPDFQALIDSGMSYDDAEIIFNQLMEEYTEWVIAKSYVDTYMTPLNFGIPYIDEKTATNMFQWNLAQMLSNCNSEMIRIDESGEQYVYYKGFRVYCKSAQLTKPDGTEGLNNTAVNNSNANYCVYDLTDTVSGKFDYGAKGFKELTNIDPSHLGFSSDITYLGTSDDERQRICVVNVPYSVEISYEGITPLKTLLQFVWNYEVEGYDGSGGSPSTESWNSSTATLTGGGKGEAVTTLPVQRKLLFYVVK